MVERAKCEKVSKGRSWNKVWEDTISVERFGRYNTEVEETIERRERRRRGAKKQGDVRKTLRDKRGVKRRDTSLHHLRMLACESTLSTRTHSHPPPLPPAPDLQPPAPSSAASPREVVVVRRNVGVIRPQHALAYGQGGPLQRLRFFQLALLTTATGDNTRKGCVYSVTHKTCSAGCGVGRKKKVNPVHNHNTLKEAFYDGCSPKTI